MSRLRPPQQRIKTEVFAHWHAGARNVLIKSPTGSGKTVVVADIVKTVDRAASVIAHRSELVSQMSVAMAREGVRHRIIGPTSLQKNCVALHIDKVGRSMYDPGARVGVGGIDTLIKRDMSSDSWFRQVGLWAMDEAHHVQKENKWGLGVGMFPNAYGLGPTATPCRADGHGLGAENDGVFHAIVYGPELRDQIDQGYLVGYRIFAPPSDVDYSSVTVTASGDLSPAKLSAAVHASDTIVGDVVKQYLRVCREKIGRLARGITFAVDVEAATELARAYRKAGVPAEIVSAKTPDLVRASILRKFEAGQVLQLVNVDLFGEGTDVPAVEIVSMVRKTESWPLFVQQFGRSLRLLISEELTKIWGELTDAQRLAYIAASDKPVGYIIDHVGNVIRHGLPDAYREDTLDRRERRSAGASDAIPLRSCPNPDPCGLVYERYRKVCPYCQYQPEPLARTDPKFVDGDLFELDEATLTAMRGQVAKVDGIVHVPHGVDGITARAIQNRHTDRQAAQAKLRELIALWAGWVALPKPFGMGLDLSESYRVFYSMFGVDTLTAQAYGRPEAEALSLKIQQVLDKHGVAHS